MPKNPYNVLMNEAVKFAGQCKNRERRIMWRYPKDQLKSGRWLLGDLWERVQAAEQLGYDVQLIADDKGLAVQYVKKIPEKPWHWEFRNTG